MDSVFQVLRCAVDSSHVCVVEDGCCIGARTLNHLCLWWMWLKNDRVRTSMKKSECGVPSLVSHVPNVCGFEDVKVCYEALWSAWGWDVS